MRLSGYISSLSLKNKMLISSIATVLVPLLILGMLTYYMSTNIVINKSINSSKSKISMIQKNISMINDFIKENINVISVDKDIQRLLKEYPNAVNAPSQLGAKNALFETLYSKTFQTTWTAFSGITDKHGEILAITGNVEYKAVHDIIIEASKDMLYTNQKNTYWTGLHKLKYLNGQDKNMIVVIKPVYHVDEGSYIGSIFFFIDEETLSSIYDDEKESPSAEFKIIDSSGTVISASKKEHLYLKVNIDNNSGLHKDANGEKLLVSKLKISIPEWEIIYTIPIAEITSENGMLLSAFIIIGTVSFILSVLLAFVFSKRISSPLEKLKSVMSEIKEGNYKIRVNDLGKNEIGEVGITFNIMMERINVLIDELREQSLILKKSELRLIQEQMNPHFLYNTIESIVSLINLNMNEKAKDTALKMGDFYRIALSTGHFMITLDEEIKLTASYLYIQKIRYHEYMDYSIEFDQTATNFLIPKLTIQPLVENAIYHGLRRKRAIGFVEVRVKNQSGKIIIEVYDNGAGMSEHTVKELLNSEGKSFGVSSVKKRLQFVFCESFKFEIESEEGNFSLIRLVIDTRELKGEVADDQDYNS